MQGQWVCLSLADAGPRSAWKCRGLPVVSGRCPLWGPGSPVPATFPLIPPPGPLPWHPEPQEG